MEKIGILGSGNVGQALGTAFVKLGHKVMLGSRDAAKLAPWKSDGGENAFVGSFEDAAKFGEVIFVATKWAGTENALKLAGPLNMAGKIAVDVTNPLDVSGGLPSLAIGFDTSAGEKVQEWLPESYVVKTLNIINNKHMANPKYEEGEPDMLLCGNDNQAKEKVRKLLHSLGWKKVTDLGNIEESRLLEPLCVLWIHYGLKHNTWDHAISLLRK